MNKFEIDLTSLFEECTRLINSRAGLETIGDEICISNSFYSAKTKRHLKKYFKTGHCYYDGKVSLVSIQWTYAWLKTHQCLLWWWLKTVVTKINNCNFYHIKHRVEKFSENFTSRIYIPTDAVIITLQLLEEKTL